MFWFVSKDDAEQPDLASLSGEVAIFFRETFCLQAILQCRFGDTTVWVSIHFQNIQLSSIEALLSYLLSFRYQLCFKRSDLDVIESTLWELYVFL